jgi:hypothetical protein
MFDLRLIYRQISHFHLFVPGTERERYNFVKVSSCRNFTSWIDFSSCSFVLTWPRSFLRGRANLGPLGPPSAGRPLSSSNLFDSHPSDRPYPTGSQKTTLSVIQQTLALTSSTLTDRRVSSHYYYFFKSISSLFVITKKSISNERYCTSAS